MVKIIVPISTEVFDSRINASNTKALLQKVISPPSNEHTFDIGNEVVAALEGDDVTTPALTVLCDDGEDPTEFPQAFLYTLTASGLPPHWLTLKRGAIVMLLRSLDTKNRLCNGSRLIVCKLQNPILECKFLPGTSKGDKVLIPKSSCSRLVIFCFSLLSAFSSPYGLCLCDND